MSSIVHKNDDPLGKSELILVCVIVMLTNTSSLHELMRFLLCEGEHRGLR